MSEGAFPIDVIPQLNIKHFQDSPDERVWKGDFTFIQGADCQLGLIDRYILKLEKPNWDKEIKLTKDAIRKINSMDPLPAFFIICGDMLDAFPFEGEEKKLRDQQYTDFVKIVKDLDPKIKLVCVCGNHDVGDIPNTDTVAIYRKQFGPDYFSFWCGGVKFVVLNSQYMKSAESVPEETEKQNIYLDTIADSNAKHIVTFQHIPFFLNHPDEESDVYFNIDKDQRIRILDKLLHAGVRYIFCGHYHRNAGGKYKDIEQVVTSAIGGPLGRDPSGYRVVRVYENKIEHEYVSIEKGKMNH